MAELTDGSVSTISCLLETRRLQSTSDVTVFSVRCTPPDSEVHNVRLYRQLVLRSTEELDPLTLTRYLPFSAIADPPPLFRSWLPPEVSTSTGRESVNPLAGSWHMPAPIPIREGPPPFGLVLPSLNDSRAPPTSKRSTQPGQSCQAKRGSWVSVAKYITYRDVIVEAKSNNASVEPKNGDFFNSLNVEHIKMERVWVDSDDDCFSPKSNNTDVHSLGSLGQYEGEFVFVKDVVIENVWAGPEVAEGFVDNVTFRNFCTANGVWPISLESCYFNIDPETSRRHPSKMNVTNVLFENFRGYSSGANGRAVARVRCSTNTEAATCRNIRFENFNVTSPCGGEPVVICDGIDSDLGVPYVSFDSEEAQAALADKCEEERASIELTLPGRVMMSRYQQLSVVSSTCLNEDKVGSSSIYDAPIFVPLIPQASMRTDGVGRSRCIFDCPDSAGETRFAVNNSIRKLEHFSF
ncbi:pectin lyase-like protein [Sodiomyces alkalinus F11]|uniref:galacturonan 1,4-alpha-galacturonidase n=1 Tax=Sodiomyces alkalinus (strain CBS 110278 / VKM F-3762 / F11) TaxID=1314773 RepID=A0A3N2PVK6_SODAK|nr:pectin lyase-like protein [Sodiomyces alkalinus F11]ROT38535.1 pectin lyase-like protein [Sodiomyces alkalinus F11]